MHLLFIWCGHSGGNTVYDYTMLTWRAVAILRGPTVSSPCAGEEGDRVQEEEGPPQHPLLVPSSRTFKARKRPELCPSLT